ncbi:MAG: SusC/RagA family TonB-linked outer membrane protein, partial [Bacteroidota bacterium]|nr:SusC/RagA family TonB-linked outer membrane protein [Bacteroidota bacterium]
MQRAIKHYHKTIIGLFMLCAFNAPTEARALNSRNVNLTNNLAPVHKNTIINWTITGKVASASGEALPGVTVLLKGTNIGTATGPDGTYSLSVPETKGTLVFSFVGYTTQEKTFSGPDPINITLTDDAKALQELVVVGYGTQKKSDVTGSVASVSTEEIQRVPVTSMAQTLQGRVAGVQVTQASHSPGGGVSIRIRGGNSIQGGNEPLYVVDGYPLYNENGATINPNDIESIDILKDASATAIYGSRGANGVVLITTKRGKAGKSTISFDTYYSVQKVQKTLPLLNAREYAELVKEANENVGKPVPAAFADPSIYGEGTNWQDEIFRTAPTQNYQLTFTGGDDKTRYAISGNYFNQQGVIINSKFERGSLRFNFERNLTPKLKIGNNLTVARTRSNRVPTDGSGGSSLSAVYSALNFSPTVPVYNPDGSLVIDNVAGGIKISNPVGVTSEVINMNIGSRFLGNVYADYEFFKGLNLRVSLGANAQISKNNDYIKRTIFNGVGTNGSGSVGMSQFTEWQNTNTLTYNKTFNEKHGLNLLLGFEMLGNRFESVLANTQNYSNDILLYNNLGSAGTTLTGASSTTQGNLISYFARANYDFAGRYLFTATTRVDGSSKFGAGNKYAVFPSGSVAWRLSEEEFMKGIGYLNELKIRTSYGLSGNQEIGQYQSLAALGVQNYNYGGTQNIGFGPSRIANPDLKWETTAQFDAGLDISLFQNRISITADYFIKNTRDLLLNVPLPITSGY